MTASIAATEIYDDVRDLIAKTVRQFVGRYGGDVVEMTSRASLLFMEAWAKWDMRRTTFQRFLRYYIWHAFLEEYRMAYTRNNRVRRNYIAVDGVAKKEASAFDVSEFAGQLSKDAATVAMLLFETPMEIKMSLIETGKDTPGQFRRAIKEYLQDLGWTAHAVARSFAEIKNAL